MALVAEDGVAALLEAWQKSGRDLKEHVQAQARRGLGGAQGPGAGGQAAGR